MVLTETQDRQILVNPLRRAKPELRRLRFSFFDSLVKEPSHCERSVVEKYAFPVPIDIRGTTINKITSRIPRLSFGRVSETAEPLSPDAVVDVPNVGTDRRPCQHLI
jgi:hypothetical protein